MMEECCLLTFSPRPVQPALFLSSLLFFALLSFPLKKKIVLEACKLSSFSHCTALVSEVGGCPPWEPLGPKSRYLGSPKPSQVRLLRKTRAIQETLKILQHPGQQQQYNETFQVCMVKSLNDFAFFLQNILSPALRLERWLSMSGTRQLKTVCNSSSRGFGSFFWLSVAFPLFIVLL